MEVIIFLIIIIILWFSETIKNFLYIIFSPKIIKYIYTTPLKPYDNLDMQLERSLKNIWYNISLDEILFMKFALLSSVFISLSIKYKWTQREKFYIEKNQELIYHFETRYEREFNTFYEETKTERLDFYFEIFIRKDYKTNPEDIFFDINNIAQILINRNLNKNYIIKDIIVITLITEYIYPLDKSAKDLYSKLDFWMI